MQRNLSTLKVIYDCLTLLTLNLIGFVLCKRTFVILHTFIVSNTALYIQRKRIILVVLNTLLEPNSLCASY